jgi:hypothetical protein
MILCAFIYVHSYNQYVKLQDAEIYTLILYLSSLQNKLCDTFVHNDFVW